MATVLLTGAFHEDALADAADGLGGGRDRERMLEIMRDSRIGSYGAVALVLVLGARLGCLAELATPDGARALIGAHVLARWSSLPLIRPAAVRPGPGSRPSRSSAAVTRLRLAIGTRARGAARGAGARVPRAGRRSRGRRWSRRWPAVFPRSARRHHRRLPRRRQPGGGAVHLPRGAGMRLLLVRHGEAEGQEGRVIGHSDLTLSARGRADIAASSTARTTGP